MGDRPKLARQMTKDWEVRISEMKRSALKSVLYSISTPHSNSTPPPHFALKMRHL